MTTRNPSKHNTTDTTNDLHFDVSTGLKRVLGRELITNDEVAIFELVKNSFDAEATEVHLHFDEDSVTVADNGTGMSRDDLHDKWLLVAYSAKKDAAQDPDYRDAAVQRRTYAGSKGIGRFSSDRIGTRVTVQTRSKTQKDNSIHVLSVNWEKFDGDHKALFDQVPIRYESSTHFALPDELAAFSAKLHHGTIITITNLRRTWDRAEFLHLKSSLSKLINPFGDKTDGFRIIISAPSEHRADQRVINAAARKEREPEYRRIVNGPVGNFVFADLRHKTTFIHVSIGDGYIKTTLTDRGEIIYKIREPNSYQHLRHSGFSCEIYYLNRSARTTFTRRIGVPSVRFGSVFLFRNNFRVYPIGEERDDWFGFDRRKQQGHSRYLGTREIIGRVDVFGSDDDFQEASSRNQGLIQTEAVNELRKAVMEHCLKRLERYVVPVSWVDKADAMTDDLSRLMTEPGRARVSAAVANLVDNDDVELITYNTRLVKLLNERSSHFESSLVSLRAIARKTGDDEFLAQLDRAEQRFEELKKTVAAAEKAAAEHRAAATAATARAHAAEEATQHEKRRSQFLESAINVETATILNLHHQATIYAVSVAQQIENLLTETCDVASVARSTMLQALESIAFLNAKILAITKLATRANFQLDSEKIETDVSGFIADYVRSIAQVTATSRMHVEVTNTHPSLILRFSPIDISILVDNLVSNARRAKATEVTFELERLEGNDLLVVVSDNGRGLGSGVDPERIFEMGYSTTHGAGLGLYHVRQVLGEMGGSIVLRRASGPGLTFAITIAGRGKS